MEASRAESLARDEVLVSFDEVWTWMFNVVMAFVRLWMAAIRSVLLRSSIAGPLSFEIDVFFGLLHKHPIAESWELDHNVSIATGYVRVHTW